MKKLIGLTVIAVGVLASQSSYADLFSSNSSRAPAFSQNAHVGNVKICPHLAEKAGCTAMENSETCGAKIVGQYNQNLFSTRVTK